MSTNKKLFILLLNSFVRLPKIVQMLIMCPDKSLLESLKDANHMLEVVQKGLSDYLEYKRMIFPRLFFLSDDELLEILAQARNPLAVQPHLRKCFENIASVNLSFIIRFSKYYSYKIDLKNKKKMISAHIRGGFEDYANALFGGRMRRFAANALSGGKRRELAARCGGLHEEHR